MSTTQSEIATLWKLLPHPKGSVVRLFARKGSERNGDFARNAREIEQFAKQYVGWNVYVAPNPTSYMGGERHAAKDVSHWSYLLIDVDPVCRCERIGTNVVNLCDTCAGEANPMWFVGEALELLMDATGHSTGATPIVIDSGRGAQAWIRLNDVRLDNNEPIDRKIARKTNSYWLKWLDEEMGYRYGCQIDTSTSDLPRVMRCPGIFNVKTGKMAKFFQPSPTIYALMHERLIAGVPKSVFEEPEVPGLEAGQKWQQVFPHLTLTAQNYLLYGQEEPGRHKVVWHTARKLAELGVTREEARRALRRANELKGEEEELEPDQIEHALNTAYSE